MKMDHLEQKIHNLEEKNLRMYEQLDVVYTNHCKKYDPKCDKCKWNLDKMIKVQEKVFELSQ